MKESNRPQDRNSKCTFNWCLHFSNLFACSLHFSTSWGRLHGSFSILGLNISVKLFLVKTLKSFSTSSCTINLNHHSSSNYNIFDSSWNMFLIIVDDLFHYILYQSLNIILHKWHFYFIFSNYSYTSNSTTSS